MCRKGRNDKFSGLVFHVAGEFPGFVKKDMRNFIRKHGGKISDTPSEWDYLVRGAFGGRSKKNLAVEHSVPIVSKRDLFYNVMFGTPLSKKRKPPQNDKDPESIELHVEAAAKPKSRLRTQTNRRQSKIAEKVKPSIWSRLSSWFL